MEFYEAVGRRRMVRNYTDQPVDPEALDRIADAGRRTPSAGFSQGVALVIVTDEALRSQIAEFADEAAYVAKGLDPWISKAPAHIVLCVSEQAYHRRYQEVDKLNDDGTEIEWPVPYWWVDAGAAMQNMLVAAVAEDLAAGFLGAHAAPEIGALLGVPDEYHIVGIITIGHPAPDRRSGSLKRGWRDLSDVVHRDRWTG
ncbi:MAG: nitroreductase [Acidimicrobiia bacterium]|nr:nitroreductase [Acidimicrobiia bacterium]